MANKQQAAALCEVLCSPERTRKVRVVDHNHEPKLPCLIHTKKGAFSGVDLIDRSILCLVLHTKFGILQSNKEQNNAKNYVNAVCLDTFLSTSQTTHHKTIFFVPFISLIKEQGKGQNVFHYTEREIRLLTALTTAFFLQKTKNFKTKI